MIFTLFASTIVIIIIALAILSKKSENEARRIEPKISTLDAVVRDNKEDLSLPNNGAKQKPPLKYEPEEKIIKEKLENNKPKNQIDIRKKEENEQKYRDYLYRLSATAVSLFLNNEQYTFLLKKYPYLSLSPEESQLRDVFNGIIFNNYFNPLSSTDNLVKVCSTFMTKQYMEKDWFPSNKTLDQKYELFSDRNFWNNEKQNRENPNAENTDPIDWKIRKRIVHTRDKSSCRRCGVNLPLEHPQTHIHHIIPRSQYGDHSINNLILLCSDCHTFMFHYSYNEVSDDYSSFTNKKTDGHQELRGEAIYYLSTKKVAHLESCRYSKKITRTKLTHAYRLKWEGYRLCKICDPMKRHKELVKSWKPNISIDIENFEYSYSLELGDLFKN